MTLKLNFFLFFISFFFIFSRNIEKTNNDIEVLVDIFIEYKINKDYYGNENNLMLIFVNKSTLNRYNVTFLLIKKDGYSKNDYKELYDYKGITTILYDNENILNLPLNKIPFEKLNNSSNYIKTNDHNTLKIVLDKNGYLLDLPSDVFMNDFYIKAIEKGVKFDNISKQRKSKILKKLRKNKRYFYTKSHLEEYKKYDDSIRVVILKSLEESENTKTKD
jgi:hypothetical protein